MLFITSTPIGNLKDITLRAIETLKDVDLIAAEDTRHTKNLLKHYDITTPLTSYHDHNKEHKAPQLIQKLKEGQDIALVSDAGTPGISDPGFRLIRLAKEEEIEMTVIPGACAAIAALTLSALPSDQFTFKGFLPVKTAARCKKLGELKEKEGTFIFYESPHRIVKALKDIEEVLGDPEVVVARELTKLHEEVLTKKASQMADFFSSTKPRGEFVVLISTN